MYPNSSSKKCRKAHSGSTHLIQSIASLSILNGSEFVKKITAFQTLSAKSLISSFIMEPRIVLASACVGCLAVLLFGIFPEVLAGNTFTFLDYFSKGLVQEVLPSRDDQGNGGQRWNILYHLGGNGPWIPKLHGIADRDIDPPSGCTVDQVHMVGLKTLREVGILSDTFVFFRADVKAR